MLGRDGKVFKLEARYSREDGKEGFIRPVGFWAWLFRRRLKITTELYDLLKLKDLTHFRVLPYSANDTHFELVDTVPPHAPCWRAYKTIHLSLPGPIHLSTRGLESVFGAVPSSFSVRFYL